MLQSLLLLCGTFALYGYAVAQPLFGEYKTRSQATCSPTIINQFLLPELEHLKVCNALTSTDSIGRLEKNNSKYYLCVAYYESCLRLCNTYRKDDYTDLLSSVRAVAESKNVTEVCKKLPNVTAYSTASEPTIRELVDAVTVQSKCNLICTQLDLSVDPLCSKTVYVDDLINNYRAPKSETIAPKDSVAPVQNEVDKPSVKVAATVATDGKKTIETIDEKDGSVAVAAGGGPSKNEDGALPPLLVPFVRAPPESFLPVSVEKNEPPVAPKQSGPIAKETKPGPVVGLTPDAAVDAAEAAKVASPAKTIQHPAVSEKTSSSVDTKKTVETIKEESNPNVYDDGADINGNFESEDGDDLKIDQSDKPEQPPPPPPPMFKPNQAEKPSDTSDNEFPNPNNYQTINSDGQNSYFFSYFLFFTILFVIGYVGYHNKQKILALLLEGRRGRGTRRRPNTASYRKLDCNLEEAVTSSCSTNSAHVIY